MAKGDFYFPFLYQRFYDSTTGWTEEQEGAYLRLLTYQFKNGSIPNDMKLIKRISPKAVKNWSLFRSKFEQNNEGNLINFQMEKTRVYMEALRDKNMKNGKLGGRPRNPGVNPNGNPNHIPEANPEITLPIPIPLEITKEESVLKSEPAHDLSKSNLYRQPKVPTKDQVLEAIVMAGGDKKMAKSFWEKHTATGWFINGSPVVDYTALAQKFVSTWKSIENKNESPPVGPKLKPLVNGT